MVIPFTVETTQLDKNSWIETLKNLSLHLYLNNWTLHMTLKYRMSALISLCSLYNVGNCSIILCIRELTKGLQIWLLYQDCVAVLFE